MKRNIFQIIHYERGAAHINTTNLPSGEFSCWGLLLAQRPENFCARGRTESLELYVDKRALFRTPTNWSVPVKNCRCDIVISTRNILSSRYYSYFLSAPRDASRFHFLFASLAPRKRKREREKEQRTNSRKYENATRYALEFTGDDTHVTHFLYAFAFLFLFFFSLCSLFLFPFRQITDFRRSQVLCFMYIQPPQWQRTVLRRNIAGQQRIYRGL